MKEAIICLTVYVGSLFLMSLGNKETPNVPTPQVCTETKAPKRGDETPPAISKDCSPKPASVPSKPKVEK